MAYLPFYITPEKFQEYQTERAEQIKEDTDAISWMCKNVEHKYRYYRIAFCSIPIIGMILFALFLVFASGDRPTTWSEVMYIFLPPIIVVAWAGYLSYGIDDRYDYTLSSSGLIYQKRLDEPLWGPRFVQIMAYIACVASILAVVIMGPLALVGSGGFLLLAFACTKKREIDVEKWVVPSDQFVCARQFKKRKVICLYAKKEYCIYSHHENYPNQINRAHIRGDFFLFYKTPHQLANLTNLLENKLKVNIEIVESPEMIFEFDKWPQPVIDLLMFSEQFYPEDTIGRTEDERPKGQTQEEVNKEIEPLLKHL